MWLSFLIFQHLSHGAIPSNVKSAFIKAGGSQKAIAHLDCFLNQHQHTRFKLKPANRLKQRCNQIEAGDALISINKPNIAVIVDNTMPSSKRRFFILDLTGSPKKRALYKYYTSHGRYLNTPHRNTTPGRNKNTIKWMKYFGNIAGSNASSTGFYISGSRYQGRWVGPAGDKYSMIVHGIERGINDNACERAIVVHGNNKIREWGPQKGVNSMSSGCFMVDYAKVNFIVEKLRGQGDEKDPDLYNGGVVFFSHGPREEKLSNTHYCDADQKDLFYLD